MESQRKVDTKDLESKIGQLQKHLAFATGTAGSSDLLTIVHRPGWTTIIDVEFAAQLLETMNHQAVAMQGIRDALQKHVAASTK